MEKEFHGHANKGGVYKITNLKNGKIYIGSAKRFKERVRQHTSSLRNNKHQNKHLQASFNKHGEDAFLFEVLEVVEGDKGERFRIEQKYIDKLIKEGKWEQTFNFKKKAEQKERSCFSKTPEETRKKLSMALQNNQNALGHIVSKKAKEKIAYGMKGNSNHLCCFHTKTTKEIISKKIKEIRNTPRAKHQQSKISKKMWEDKKYKEKLREIHKNRAKNSSVRKQLANISSKHYLVTSPDGKTFEIINLKKFCITHNLNYCLMNKVASGKLGYYKKWSVRKM